MTKDAYDKALAELRRLEGENAPSSAISTQARLLAKIVQATPTVTSARPSRTTPPRRLRHRPSRRPHPPRPPHRSYRIGRRRERGDAG